MSNQLAEIKTLLSSNKPQAVGRANVDRASKLVGVVQQIDKLQTDLAKEIEDELRPIRREIKQHQRQLQKMFSSVLPEQKKVTKTKEKYSHVGLKNWMVEYVQAWRQQQLHQKPATVEQLRKSAGIYNRKAFSNKIDNLIDVGLLRRNETGGLLIQELPVEVSQ